MRCPVPGLRLDPGRGANGYTLSGTLSKTILKEGMKGNLITLQARRT